MAEHPSLLGDRTTGPGTYMGISAQLGPTNTGKTHRAIEQLLSHRSGIIGLPLRLLAREVYDRVTAKIGEQRVALVTGEEKRIPRHPRYWICTVESMPLDREVDFVCVDEIQLATHRQRGHTFTDRLLHARGMRETWFLGSDAMIPVMEQLVPTAEVHRHPRFSRLHYGGLQSIGSLPPRTAVVAFSVAEVYELAERIRQRHGGTAVVLGALSPRARNAQVAMYESGEVEYMVATDAIGMGLNLDLDRVVFASTHKFDGKESRPLHPAELGQIAGRAGRYTRDGSFGLLRPNPTLPPPVVQRIENHDFEPVRRVVWRNSDLDMSSPTDLVASLRARPRRPALHAVERADDFDALEQLLRLTSVRKRAVGEAAVSLLWDVCRIPDFRKLMLESHVQLLARIYDQLAGPNARIDPDWMGRRIQRLDDTTGDIDTLMTRMAFIRTWTYVANQDRWVRNAARWQEITRAIEDRHSDALHERLTERFVAQTVGTPTRPAGKKRPAPSQATRSKATASPLDPAHPFAALADLPVAREPLVDEADDFVQCLVEAGHTAFSVDARGRISFGDLEVGRWQAGQDLLHPDIRLASLDLGRGALSRIRRRLQAWTADVVEGLVGSLAPLESAGGASVRGIAYQLKRGLGTVEVLEAREQVAKLTDDDRALLATHGVTVGTCAVWLAAAQRTRSLVTRRALVWVREPWEETKPWGPGATSWALPPSLSIRRVAALGYVPLGTRAVRVDLAERCAQALAEAADAADPFVPPSAIASWLGCRRRQLTSVLRGLGYWRVRGDSFSRHRPTERQGRRGRS